MNKQTEEGDVRMKMADGVQRAALYIRVSTEEQAQHGLSLPEQRGTLEEYARTHGLAVAGVYADEGISARKRYSKRPALLRLLEDVRAGKIDLILFTKLDRWFRNVGDYYEVQRVLDDAGVSWQAVREDYETVTASGRLKVNIMLSVAQDEADRTGERIRAVFDSKVSRGEAISGKVPLGYRIENKRLVVDEEKAAIARDIFERYVSLRSMRALRQYIMERYGLVYSYSGIRAMLQNERYIGHAHGQEDFCPPLIQPDTFALVQRIVAERAQRNSGLRNGGIYLFTGLVYCSECGNRLSAHTVGGKYIYYRCTRYEKLHLCQHKKRTSELVLEDWLVHNLVSQFTIYNLKLEEKASNPPPKVDIGKIKRKMEKLKDLYLNDLIDRESYEQDYTALREELRAASEAAPPPPSPVDIKAIADSLALYSELPRAYKKELWAKIIGKIVITNEDEFFVYPISP